MALSMSVTHRDVPVANAYCRVRSVVVNKTSMTFDVTWAATSSAIPLLMTEYASTYDLFGDNPIRQAYLYLKTLPEFANAVDC
jgi:hypothetical protein